MILGRHVKTLNGGTLEVLRTLAPAAYELIQKARTKRTDEQELILLAYIAQTTHELKVEMSEIQRIQGAKLDELLSRTKTYA